MQGILLPGQGSSSKRPSSGISLLEPSQASPSASASHACLSRSDVSNLPTSLASRLDSFQNLLDLAVRPLIQLLSSPPKELVDRLPPASRAAQVECDAEQLIKSPGWTREVQLALLRHVLPDWGPRLRDEGIWESLLRAWFYPEAPSTAPLRPGGQHGKARAVEVLVDEDDRFGRGDGQLQASALSVLSQSLASLSSSAGSVASPMHPETRRALLFLVEQVPRALSLSVIWSFTSSLSNAARTELAWADAVKLTLGLRDRVGNAFAREMPECWSESSYVKMLAKLVDDLVASQLPPSCTWPISSPPPATPFISRLIKQGLFALGPGATEGSLSLELVRRALGRAGSGTELRWDESYERGWKVTMRGLRPEETAKVRAAVVETLDGCIRRRSLEGLLAREEPQEGERFLSREAGRLETSAVALLELFSPRGKEQRSSLLQQAEEDSEEEDEGDSTIEDIVSLCTADLDLELRSSLGVRTPVMARALVALASKEIKTDESPKALLEGLVRCWSKPERVRRTTRSEEIYLSTLLVAALGQLKDTSLAASLQTNPSFLTGVSAHIDSNDALVRRMGMLLAELVSAAAAAAGKAKKPLSFGSSMWAGKGEGREEARVLRRLWQDDAAPVSPAEDLWLQLWGLGPVEEEPRPSDGPIIDLIAQPKNRKEALTRRLPERRPPQPSQPPSSHLDLLGSLRPAVRRPMIVDIDAAGSDDDGHRQAKPLAGFAMPVEEEDDGSSSESDSSGDDEDDERGALKGLSGMGLDEGLKAAGLGANVGKGGGPSDDGLGSNLPAQKRRRAPIYINELSPMLKESDRDANRIAIKHSAELIRRKAGWGGEVDENAVDLAYALTGAQNNYGIKSFEDRRREALHALVVASPRNAAPCLIELLFSFQYSLAQRISLLQALAGAVRELAGLPPLPGPNQSDALHSDVLESAAEGVTDEAVKRARNNGERRVPEIQRQKALLVNSKPRIQEVSPFGGSTSAGARLSGAVTRQQERYADIASSCFIFPFLGRLRAQLEDVSHREAMGKARKGYGGSVGSSSLLGPMMLSRIIDTLSVLVSSAATSLEMASSVAPETLELALFVTVTVVPYLSAVPLLGDLGGGQDAGAKDNASALSGALSGLVLVTLDAACETDGGRWLMRNRRDLVQDVREWAQAVFEQEDKRDRVAAAMGRAGRASASILLRLHEMDEDT